jgi:GH25 family lysozyme M1 (1,4-beta-N-acetylmuramidase)
MATAFALGIDMSSYQSVDNWAAVKNFGTAKAYCKATEGATWVDPTYFSHMNGARNAGIQPGPYHFWRPNDGPDVQARWFCQHAGWNPEWMAPVLDLEVVAPGQSASDAAAAVRAWLEIVDNFTGTRCRIYTNVATWQALGNPANFTQHQLWIAYPTGPGSTAVPPGIGGWGPAGWTGWQYSFDGQVAGISGAVDLTHWRP